VNGSHSANRYRPRPADLGDLELGSVNDHVAFAFAAGLADDGDLAVAVHGHQVAVPVVNGVQVDEVDRTRVAVVDRSRSMAFAAVPPMWKVRMVSCVPGSPIDWAAMMPIASPISTSLP